jgi:hypothetical protein
MDTPAKSLLALAVIYDGRGPVFWSGDADSFGLQDASEVLHRGDPEPDGAVAFRFSLEVKTGRGGAPVFVGPFAHGPPAKRFLYLGWRNRDGAFAQRLIIPLTSIGWDLVREALGTGDPLVCRLVDKQPRATKTGANIGGTRHVDWELGKRVSEAKPRQVEPPDPSGPGPEPQLS